MPITDTAFDTLLDLDGLAPATTDDAEAEYSSVLNAACYTVISQHHAYGHPMNNGMSSSYLVVRDGSAVGGMPGDPHYTAIHIRRDRTAGRYHFESSAHPLPVLAQHWLIQRGADAATIAVLTGNANVPANAETTELEHRLRSSGDGLGSGDSYARNLTWDPGWKPGEAWRGDDHVVHDWYTWVILDDDLAPPGSPVRVLFEDVDYPAGTYTLTEGAFPDRGSAQEWTHDPRQPLPPPPVVMPAPTRPAAATARSTGLPGPVAPPPAAAPSDNPTRGRTPGR